MLQQVFFACSFLPLRETDAVLTEVPVKPGMLGAQWLSLLIILGH